MIESADYLLHKHFDKYLEDPNVEILDPATGTGTFVCDLIDYIRKEKLAHKYRNEIHANEVAILPYYISNLNIEFTYTQKMGSYAEFKNICFVDTLDNMGFNYKGKQGTLDFFSEENSLRIQKQNEKKIAVIIGNPPYNANQTNENDNNKNREYPLIDKRIKDTFIKHSTAQKTKVYDMYARFYRWAFDRLNNNGVVAFVTNRSFIDSRTFDGFRKTIGQEFEAAYIIDTRSDVRANPKIAGTTHNVFGIQTGVAIMFLVKKQNRENETCKIHYIALDDFWRKEQKLQWLAENSLKDLMDKFEIIRPDKNNNWINLTDNDFESLLPLCSKDVKAGKSKKTLFELFSLGVVTARDEWVYDNDKKVLSDKVNFLIDIYNRDLALYKGEDKNKIKDLVDYTIKWTRAAKNDLSKEKKYIFGENEIIESLYRPFVKKQLYFNKELNEMRYQLNSVFCGKNISINFLCVNSSNELATLASDKIFDYCLLKKGNGGTQCLPLYRYDKNGKRIDNITDWGLEQFREHYGEKTVTKQDIFHYVYAVLHNPAYRKKYELNLKREFPRIPFYDNFHHWVIWGKQLMDLHLNYGTVEPYPLRVVDNKGLQPSVKPKLKADKTAGIIHIDEQTELKGIPTEAWEYKLGNRSALEWILDQYQEKKPKDPTIAEKFNTYHFADYKEQVIDLLKRVCSVSVETMKIVGFLHDAAKDTSQTVNETVQTLKENPMVF
jgi:predicted helicase